MKIKILVPCVIFLVILFDSCKKEEDDSAPYITISSPSASATFNVFDTMVVSGEVRDESPIQSILIRVLDQDQIPVLATVSVGGGGTVVPFSVEIPISNVQMTTGDYYVNVFASDGTNDANAFREIFVLEAPLEVRRYVVVSRPGSGLVRVDTISPQFDIGLLAQWNGDHSSSTVDSYHQQVAVGGGLVSDLQTIDAMNSDPLWGVVNQNTSSLKYFKDVEFSEEHLLTYVTNEDGFIRGYNGVGSTFFTATALTDFRPMQVVGVGDIVVVELEDIVPPMRRLAYYWKASGAFWEDYSLDLELVNMIPASSNSVAVFGNDDTGQAYGQEWSLSNGSYSGAQIGNGTMNDASIRFDGNSAIVATTDGIYRYTFGAQLVSTSVGGVNATHVAYDRVNALILASVGTDLRFYTSNGSLVSSVSLADEAEYIGVLYNR